MIDLLDSPRYINLIEIPLPLSAWMHCTVHVHFTGGRILHVAPDTFILRLDITVGGGCGEVSTKVGRYGISGD